MSRRPSPPNSDELWAEYARGVAPLRRQPRSDAARAAKPQPRPAPDAASPHPRPRRAPSPLPELEPGAAVDVDRRTMDKLRRGRLRPEATLDLHGMTREEAHAALSAFIVQAAARGLRAVLVVTGRGSLGSGVLREETPRWLNAPALRPRILGFSQAQPRDGGAGAIYVLLRRAKPRSAP